MKKTALILIAMSMMCGSYAQDRTKDENEIKLTLARFGNSWAKGDFSDTNEYMTEDCNWINVVGMHWKNRKEVQFAHQAFVSAMFKGVTSKEVSTTSRFITPDVAVVYWTTHVDTFYTPDGVDRGNNKQGDTDDLATIVMVKRNGKWWITSAQNSTVVKQAAASNPVLKMNK